MHHITVTNEILKSFQTKDDIGSLYNQRFHITLDDQITWQDDSISLGNNTAYIELSKARMKELKVKLEDEVSVEQKLDFSKYGFKVTEEFTEVLEQVQEE